MRERFGDEMTHTWWVVPTSTMITSAIDGVLLDYRVDATVCGVVMMIWRVILRFDEGLCERMVVRRWTLVD